MTAFLVVLESSSNKGAIRHVRVRAQNRRAAVTLGDRHARRDERVLDAIRSL
jgi:hypothetical protein